MRRGPRAPAALALLSAGLLAAGCGIRSTDVVAVGGPASAVAFPPRDQTTVLYFSGPDGLMPVLRPDTSAGALTLLFAGPNEDEKAAGMRTELPPLRGKLTMSMSEDMVTVVAGQDVAGLTPVAQRQIACTVLQAVSRDRAARVTILGTGAKSSLSPLGCPA